MSAKSELRDWFKNKRFIDLKVVPGFRRTLSTEEVAKEILRVLQGEISSTIVTSEPL